MKILFCSPCPLKKTLGMAKALIELAEELEQLGWQIDIISPEDLLPSHYMQKPWNQVRRPYQRALRAHLLEYATKYHIVDYDHSYLPYPRREFCNNTLMVARSQLLTQHLEKIRIPSPTIIDLMKIRSWRTWKIKIRKMIKGHEDYKALKETIEDAKSTLKESDIVIVLNWSDQRELVENQISKDKIFVIPNGLSTRHGELFRNFSPQKTTEKIIVFIGTFDFRKGALDFPRILSEVHKQLPGVKLRLLGTKGLYLDRKQVLAFFPNKLKPYVEVVPNFEPEDLPLLLNSCSIGIFPSYLESFGLGVLEMLTAAIPVIAYDVPGPPMMLTSDYLVSPGDVKSMSDKVVYLLNNQDELMISRRWAKSRSQDFFWKQIAAKTSEVYIENWQKKQIVSRAD